MCGPSLVSLQLLYCVYLFGGRLNSLFITSILFFVCVGASVESSKDNYGHQILVDCSEKIVAGLSSEPKAMAVTLHGKGFISTELLREITELPATKTDNARKLYLSILETVQRHPHRYSEFISILRSNTLLYSDLLKVLEETYQEKEKGQFLSLL